MNKKGEWRLTTNYISGEVYYSVVRLKDIYELDHSGNREYAMGWTKDRDKALEKLKELQERKEEGNK